ncbi:MAG: RNA polymerase sigma factor [bacterium]|nr:RNA polymerase sigma factor [bacterium]
MKKHQEKEFWQAYEAYADALFRHCYFRMYDRELAKDLVQEAFCRTWSYLAEGKEIQNTRAFLYRVLHNLIVDEVRRKKPIPLDTLEEDIAQPTNLPEIVGNILAGEKVMKLLDKLDGKYQEVIVMNFIDSLSPKEISVIIGESENVVSVRIHRGLKKVRELLEEDPHRREGI